MTTISPVGTADTQPAAQRQPAAAPSDESGELGASRGALASDFNTFLTLLTAQMKNQDPLNPAESTEFVAQLAQFSSVEQQIATNTTLTSILETLSASGQGSLAEWLGTEVKAAVAGRFDGEPLAVYPEAGELEASAAALVVSDGSGNVIAEQAFDPGTSPVIWDGTLAGGGAAPAGPYTFSVRYSAANGETEIADAEVFARVIESRRDGADIVLRLEGGSTVTTDKVSGVRRPDEATA
jgi:flagellar basal-body rod modification protein FlgD